MGFGPPVCVECGVAGYLEERKGWRCPNCADANRSSWLYDKIKNEKPSPKDNS